LLEVSASVPDSFMVIKLSSSRDIVAPLLAALLAAVATLLATLLAACLEETFLLSNLGIL
jgi:hypothetical protein